MSDWKENLRFWWETRHIHQVCDNSKTIYKDEGVVKLTFISRKHKDFKAVLKQSIKKGDLLIDEVLKSFNGAQTMTYPLYEHTIKNKIPTVIKHEFKGTYYLKGSCLTVPEGAILFDCTEHQRLHGCEHCPKKGKISVCQRAHEFITPPHTMADVEQQTDYTPNWRQP